MEEKSTEVRDPEIFIFNPKHFYRVSDMALVCWLKIQGHDSQSVQWDAGVCHWIFRWSEGLMEEIDVFNLGEALVEPKNYNRLFQATRREFFDSDPNREAKKQRR
jgi:hypothetical protein